MGSELTLPSLKDRVNELYRMSCDESAMDLEERRKELVVIEKQLDITVKVAKFLGFLTSSATSASSSPMSSSEVGEAMKLLDGGDDL